MTDTAAEEKKRLRLGESFSLHALFVLAVACVLILCAAPRPLVPSELPTLRLPEGAVAAVVAQDAKDARSAPRSPAARELERLFLEHGEMEDSDSGSSAARRRKHALEKAYAQLVAEAGALAGVRMRARELDKLEAALALRLPDEQIKGVMGIFPTALDRHGVTRDGVEVAPHFVMRTLYKVRWNLAVGQATDLALADVERMAYRGWLALHAEGLRVEVRLRELDAYAKAAGGAELARVAEARGVLLHRAGGYAEAQRALQLAHARTGSIRLRNYALGAGLSDTPDEDTPEFSGKPAP